MDHQKPVNNSVVTSYKHQDNRSNIPTEELRGFMADGAQETMRYPRDTALDPQLVWKGKDEQDREDLQVPVVPIYIQEKIQPQAIIEQVKSHAREVGHDMIAPSLFSDFNGLTFEQMLDFYHSQQHWTNRMILGDSQLVMTSLAEKEGLKGKVQMIYMDPPYGIKFGSNWQTSIRKRDVKDGKLDDVTREPEQIKAFRDTWELGIHSYLTYLRDRLTIARDLLTESGSIFVQIGDDNVHLVRCLLDEVFGTENCVSQIVYTKTASATSDLLSGTADYILWYCKFREFVKFRELFVDKVVGGDGASKYDQLQLSDGFRRSLDLTEKTDPRAIPQNSRVYRLDNLTSQSMGREKGEGAASWFPVVINGHQYLPNMRSRWKTNEEGMGRLLNTARVQVTGNTLAYVRFIDDFPAYPISNTWSDIGGIQSRADPKIYVVQTATEAIKRCMLMTTDTGDIVLDPTCGSGTTAYVAEQWGRRWITTDTSRVALALARTRLMSARFPYYLLADSDAGIKKEAEITGRFPPDHTTTDDIRHGFVYKRVPHVTLKSIANNPEIDDIYTRRFQPRMEPLRTLLNQLLGQTWEEWQIPREVDTSWPAQAQQAHKDWWRQRRERQAAIDSSIARNADTELLYDQPYEDPKRVRVAGPFTVESLSPHRAIAPDVERPTSEVEAHRDDPEGQFENTIIENLKKAGVQNTIQGERLAFDVLDVSIPERYIQARGEYTDKQGAIRRVAVSIGPRYGAVGSEQIQLAALEAKRGIGCDVLLVCAFAFDPAANERVKEMAPIPTPQQQSNADGGSFAIAERSVTYGSMQILLVRVNADLNMGDNLLKKTGAGNLFTVFGQPDIQLKRTTDGKIIVHLRGVDVYDPTTHEMRNNSTDNIACWFLDTNYNDKSFYVRHAYFTGASDTYERLKRSLRAEIDESAWSVLYTAESLPFEPPTTGKIAVKVINDYGDEVLQIFPVK